MGKFSATLALLFFCCSLMASREVLSEGGAEYQLEELVVTATRTQVPTGTIPGRVDVLDQKAIQTLASPHSKVDELLQYLPGVTAVRTNGIYSLGAQATLRGLTAEQSRTLVLVDGVPINKSDTGEVNFNRINIRDIERVEVYKGPASSIYGSSAMGGVINIITRKPKRPFSGFAEAFYGTYDTYGGNLGFSVRPFRQKDGGPFVGLSLHYLDSDGYVSAPSGERTVFTTDRYAEEFTGALSLGYDFDTENSVTFRVEYYDDKRGEGEKIRADDGVSRDFDTQFYLLKYKGRSDLFRWELTGFYQHENYKRIVERLRRGRYTRYDVDSDRKDMGINVLLSHAFGERGVLTGGVDYKVGSVDAVDLYKTSPDRAVNKGKMHNLGIWAVYEARLLDGKLSVLPSLRFDYAEFYDGYFSSTDPAFASLSGDLDSHSWTHVSPKLGVRYRFTDDFSLYASYGRGFRASILDDLCRSGILWGIYKVANPSLEPEKIDSFEMGFDWNPASEVKVGGSIYYSVGRDFLYFVPTGQEIDGKPVYRRENVGKVKSYGAELEMSCRIIDRLKIFLNYTYAKAYISEFEKNEALEGKDLVRTPRHQVKAGLAHDTPWFSYSIYGLFKDRQYVYTNELRGEIDRIDGYIVVNGKAWKELFRGLFFEVAVENIFDDRYTETEEEKNPGRFITATLRYEF